MTDRSENGSEPKKGKGVLQESEEAIWEYKTEKPKVEIIDPVLPAQDNSKEKLSRLTQFFGLHPLVGFGLFAIDWMLFAAEGASFGAAWVISIPVAVFLGVGSILIQKYGYKDDWGLAVGKGIVVGLLTAIPTPLPSIVPLLGGGLGVVNLLLDSGKRS